MLAGRCPNCPSVPLLDAPRWLPVCLLNSAPCAQTTGALPSSLTTLVCTSLCASAHLPQVHKINRFTQAQTAALERRLARLQEKADAAETQREKDALLEVRSYAAADCCTVGHAGMQVPLCSATT